MIFKKKNYTVSLSEIKAVKDKNQPFIDRTQENQNPNHQCLLLLKQSFRENAFFPQECKRTLAVKHKHN